MQNTHHIKHEVINKTINCTNNTQHKRYFLVQEGELHLDITHNQIDSSSHIVCIVMSKHKKPAKVTINSTLNHDNTSSHVTILGIFDNDGIGDITGKIYIPNGVKKVSGHLKEHTLMLGNNVTIKNAPLLDVHSHEVQASHGATIDRINDAKLFYLMAKGLSRNQAIQLYLISLVENLIEHSEQKEMIKKNIINYLNLTS